MKTVIYFMILIIVSVIFSCKKETLMDYDIKGYVQKGPFNKGTNITLIALSESLDQTGLNFHSTISDNFGSFNFSNVGLSSSYVELLSDGYFFNERNGKQTSEKLVLKAIVDISHNQTVNVNILTHILTERIKHLIQNEGQEFESAKIQAQEEILLVFNLSDDNIQDYTQMNISEEGVMNSKLLAISSIILGNKEVPRLTEFLYELSEDIKEDGILNSSELQTDLATSAVFCNVGDIRKNLSSWYDNDSIFNNFQYYIKSFIDNTDFESLFELNFPEITPYGVNLLSISDNSILDTSNIYCISHNLDVDTDTDLDSTGMGDEDFRIEVVKLSGSGAIEVMINDLSDWEYHFYPAIDTIGQSQNQRVVLSCRNFNSSNKTPISLKLKGNGELVTKIFFYSSSLPDDWRGNIIRKYSIW